MLLFAAAEPTPLLVAAAADLAPLETELSASIAKATGIAVRFTFSGSGILARQIENGAPYDLYLSANEQFVRDLEKRGKLVPKTAAIYAYGFLGLWSKSGRIRHVQDLSGTTALPNPSHAPYGAAAQEMLQKLGLWTRLEPKIVYGENVLQAYQFAESGNAEACITAWSVVRAKNGILLNAGDYPPIRQMGAVVATSKRQEEARRVLRFFGTAEGKALLSRFGLGTP